MSGDSQHIGLVTRERDFSTALPFFFIFFVKATSFSLWGELFIPSFYRAIHSRAFFLLMCSAEKQRISTKSNCCNFELLRMRTRHEIVHWFTTACLSHIHRTHCAHSKQLDSCLWKCHWERQDWQRVRWRRIQGDLWSYVERFNSWSVG